MNTREDIKDIVTDSINKATKILIENPGRQSYKDASFYVSEGEKKLAALKLSPEDRKHFNILRSAMRNMRLSLEAASEGNIKKYARKMREYLQQANEYARRTGL